MSISIFEDEFNRNEIQDFFQAKKKKEKTSKFKNTVVLITKGFLVLVANHLILILENMVSGINPVKKVRIVLSIKRIKIIRILEVVVKKGFVKCQLMLSEKDIDIMILFKKPFCHNCDKKGCLGDDCFTCCREQEMNRDKYPNLKSGDYMFLNDNRL